MLFELMSAIRVHDETRTVQLRRRYVALLLDALRPEGASGTLPGPHPTDAELGIRRGKARGPSRNVAGVPGEAHHPAKTHCYTRPSRARGWAARTRMVDRQRRQ